MKRSSRYLATFLSCGVMGMWIPGAIAATYSAVTDFSISSNPNGAWSYGYQTTLGGPFSLLSTPGTEGPCAIDKWGTLPTITHPTAGGDPCIEGNIYRYTDELELHPGSLGQLAVLRWTAPSAATIDISSVFSGRNTSPTTTDVHVLKNGTSLFDDILSGFTSTAPGTCGASSSARKVYCTSGLSVAAGDVIDFAVGYGGNGNYISDTTGTWVIIDAQAVPVPAAVWMFGSALGILGLVRRRMHG